MIPHYSLRPVEKTGDFTVEIYSPFDGTYQHAHGTLEAAEAEARRFLALPVEQRGHRVVGVSVYCENPKARRKVDRSVRVATVNV